MDGGVYENYALLKTSQWPSNLGSQKIEVCDVGKALDKATGIGPGNAYEILDKCGDNPDLCSFYIAEIAKNPDVRNLATDVYSRLKANATAEAGWSQKKRDRSKSQCAGTL